MTASQESAASKRRERERLQRRAEILNAAGRVFERSGYSGATMDDVATEAELSKGTLYLYFKSKDELFLAMASRMIDTVVARFRELAAEDHQGIDLVGKMLLAYAGIAMANASRFRTAIGWMAAADQVDTETTSFANHKAKVFSVIAELMGAIQRGVDDGTIRADANATLLASQLWGGLIGVVLLRINADEMNRRFPQPIDFEAYVPGYIELLCDGLRSAGHA